MQLTNAKKIRTFRFIQVYYWCSVCAVSAYISAYFYALGYSSRIVGMLLAIQTTGGFVGQMVWSRYSDKLNNPRKIFSFGNGMVLILFPFLFLCSNLWIKACILFLNGFAYIGMPAVLDSWILTTFHNDIQLYGKIRSFGSLAFAFFALGLGYIIYRLGYIVLPIVSVLLILLLLRLIRRTTFTPILTEHKKDARSIQHLLQNKAYVVLLLSVTFLGLTAAPYLQILPLKIKEINSNNSIQGILIFVQVIVQMPVMLLVGRLSSKSPLRWIKISLGVTSASYIVFGSSTTVSMVVVAQIMNGIAYGLFLPSVRKYTTLIVSKKFYTTAFGLLDAFQLSIAGIIGIFVSGLLFETLGLRLSCMIFAIITGVGWSILFFVKKEEV